MMIYYYSSFIHHMRNILHFLVNTYDQVSCVLFSYIYVIYIYIYLCRPTVTYIVHLIYNRGHWYKPRITGGPKWIPGVHHMTFSVDINHDSRMIHNETFQMIDDIFFQKNNKNNIRARFSRIEFRVWYSNSSLRLLIKASTYTWAFLNLWVYR